MTRKISRPRLCIPLIWLVALVSCVDSTFASQSELHLPLVAEVFVLGRHAISGADAVSSESDSGRWDVVVYEIDAIQSLEHELSANLPADPEQSKKIVLHRIESLNGQTRSRMQTASMALAKAMQYGIDRFPAIVFDSRVIVYGVTDLKAALAYYQAWRRVVKP